MEDVNARVNYGLDFAKEKGLVKSKDAVVIVTGWQKGSGFTNTLRIFYVE